ncbi:MAG: UDP-glucose 4-epimerase GalE [Candidatus Gracilibacteria bacterium]|nr:UDP-glucose 4-epimerase GalE [Candidatus Gracilibacteria bacterium]
MKKTILITGGTGYIGSHAVVAFEQAGYTTVIVDNLSNSSEQVLSKIGKILGYIPDFHKADICDTKALDEVFSKHGFDGVIHFAGLKAVGESCEKPFLYYGNNILGSINLFEAMVRYKVRRIVFSSSATVYSSDNTLPLTESSKLGTTNPYGTSKLVIENVLQDLSLHASLQALPLRYFNPIGAHPSGHIGEKPNGVPNNLLPYILDVALGKREKVRVFGDDYPTIDGTGVRDYIDVNDLVDAHIAAYRKLEEISGDTNGSFTPVNIGTGRGTSVLEMIRMTEEATGKKVAFEKVGRRSGDLAEVYAGVDFAKEFLGWESEKTVKEGIESGWKFISGV